MAMKKMMMTTMLAVWCPNTKMIYAHNTHSHSNSTENNVTTCFVLVSLPTCVVVVASLSPNDEEKRQKEKQPTHTHTQLSFSSTQLSKQIQIILPKSDEFLPSYTTLVDVVCIKLDLLFPCNFRIMHLLISILFLYNTYLLLLLLLLLSSPRWDGNKELFDTIKERLVLVYP